MCKWTSIIDPLVKLAFQSTLLSVFTIFIRLTIFDVSQDRRALPPIGIEIVFPLGRLNGSDRLIQVCLP